MFISILTPVVKKRQSTVSYSFASCSSKNTVTRSTYYRVAGTSTWINASTSFNSGTAFTFGDGKISAETSYEVKYELTDAFTTISITDIVSTASVVMDFKSGGKGVAIGKVSETNNCFEVSEKWDVKVYGICNEAKQAHLRASLNTCSVPKSSSKFSIWIYFSTKTVNSVKP